jgi:hypothetical protein
MMTGTRCPNVDSSCKTSLSELRMLQAASPSVPTVQMNRITIPKIPFIACVANLAVDIISGALESQVSAVRH